MCGQIHPLKELMERENEKIVYELHLILESILLGNPKEPISAVSDNTALNLLIKTVNSLRTDMLEMTVFTHALAKGNLDVDAPGRHNYLASPFKELQSQLNSTVWTIRELAKGNIVEKMDYSGHVSQAMNSLIEKIATESWRTAHETETEGDGVSKSVNSWRYHQIISALNHLRIMLVEVDKQGNIIYANKPARERLGDLQALPIDSQLLEIEDQLIQSLTKFSKEGNDFPIIYEMFDADTGSWYRINSDVIFLLDGRSGYLHMVDDISEWKSNENRLKKTARTDSLTGLYNRGVGLKALEDILLSTAPDKLCCAAFIDVDNLKYINDTFGHTTGDEAIKTISSVLSKSVRDTDVVSRFGGDEFLITFANCSRDAAERVIGRMIEQLEAFNQTNTLPCRLSFSHGLLPIDSTRRYTVKEVITKLDNEMYQRKAEKKRDK